MGAEPHHSPAHHAEVGPGQWPEHRLVSFAPSLARSVHLLRPVAPCSQTLLRSGPTRRTWACVALFGSRKKGSPSFEPASTGSRPEDAQPRAPALVCAPPSRRPLPSKLWDVLMPQKVKSQDFKGGAGPRQEKSQSKNGNRGSARDPLMGPDRALCGRQRLGGRWPQAGREPGSRQAPVVAGMGIRDTWSGNAEPTPICVWVTRTALLPKPNSTLGNEQPSQPHRPLCVPVLLPAGDLCWGQGVAPGPRLLRWASPHWTRSSETACGPF